MILPTPTASRSAAFRVMLPCDLVEVRLATLAVRSFLAEQGLHEDELTPVELALTEACNNAIQYVGEGGRLDPVEIDAVCNPSDVELRVNDHTGGFAWPEHLELPKPESERGRGLYLIQALMDATDYYRGRGENCLVMRKTRFHQAHRSLPETPAVPGETKQRLFESRQVIREMAKELSFCHEGLSAIFRCSAELGRTNDLSGFADRLLNDLMHITSADWFLLRVVLPKEPKLAVFAASDPLLRLQPLPMPAFAQSVLSIEIKAALAHRLLWFGRRQPIEATDPLGAAKPGSIGVVQPLFQGDSLIGTLAVGRNTSQSPFGAAQIEVIRTFADFLAIEIVNARLQEEQVGTRLISHELGIARDIQRALLPRSLPQLEHFGIAGHCENARQVGGDFYDVIQVSSDSLLLLIADVMGTGIPAAMFAAIFRSLVRAMPELTHKPSELLTRVNYQMSNELSEVEMFITAQLVFVDARKRRLIAAGAGHCPILLANNSETLPKRISPEGMPLGILPTTYFSGQTVPLGNFSRVLLYTDGVTEARNEQGEFFGLERLIQWLNKTSSMQCTAQELKEELLKELRKFQSGLPLRDDQAFLILAEERHGK